MKKVFYKQMLFHYDSMPIPVVVTVIIVGGIFSYSFYSIWNHTTIPTQSVNESLVNPLNTLD